MAKQLQPPIDFNKLAIKGMAQYVPEIHCALVERLAMLGLPKRDIALRVFGIKERHFNEWLRTYPDFEMAFDNGNLLADASVTRALFERATGLTVTEQKIDKANRIVEIEKELPPDVNACLGWLERKQRKVWSKNTPEETGQNDDLAFLMGELDDEMEGATVLPSDYEDLGGLDG
ncbi:TPA: hypothetical protein ACX3EJ_001051 [Vibrio parahaemolyticus]|uniref:hypothetical protein n=1 Tax=Vibrio parahaemolyticus TaxID=670 RepID=UPI000A3D4C49|nr:hypothetical protein [Vibrio parahaemolyticus]EGQ8030267.1 hypothetical protein [Vibrio parahaemolyticus]EHV9720262.1 hypothetical protein [Vibrio parahaemolyticus]OUJ46316.1 hypothetical protein BTZ53_10895 [Vibrio parahaemolyticus]HCG6030296.1 hypothetical protein [Vibrio parahaemolyticus]HDF8527433.1 hypothetical protein [Vibrio parahaemolyticus]